jgi:hypothetical protein
MRLENDREVLRDMQEVLNEYLESACGHDRMLSLRRPSGSRGKNLTSN